MILEKWLNLTLLPRSFATITVKLKWKFSDLIFLPLETLVESEEMRQRCVMSGLQCGIEVRQRCIKSIKNGFSEPSLLLCLYVPARFYVPDISDSRRTEHEFLKVVHVPSTGWPGRRSRNPLLYRNLAALLAGSCRSD